MTVNLSLCAKAQIEIDLSAVGLDLPTLEYLINVGLRLLIFREILHAYALIR